MSRERQDDAHPKSGGGGAGTRQPGRPRITDWWSALVGGAAGNGGPAAAGDWAELTRRGLEIGGRATRELASGSYGPSSIGRDLQDWANLQLRYGRALASLWMGWPGAMGWPGRPPVAPDKPDAPPPGGPKDHVTRAALDGAIRELEHRISAPQGLPPAVKGALEKLRREVNELDKTRASRSELAALADRLPKDTVTQAALDGAIGILGDRVSELENRTRTTEVGTTEVDPRVATSLKLLAARRRKLEAEAMARHLYSALLPGVKPGEREITVTAKKIQGRSGVKAAIEALVEGGRFENRPRGQYKLVRDQLIEGILGRPWEDSRDFTGYYDQRLAGKNPKARPKQDLAHKNIVDVTLSLLESGEYRHRLQREVEAELLP